MSGRDEEGHDGNYQDSEYENHGLLQLGLVTLRVPVPYTAGFSVCQQCEAGVISTMWQMVNGGEGKAGPELSNRLLPRSVLVRSTHGVVRMVWGVC